VAASAGVGVAAAAAEIGTDGAADAVSAGNKIDCSEDS